MARRRRDGEGISREANTPTNSNLNINTFKKVISNTLTMSEAWGRSVRVSEAPDAIEEWGTRTIRNYVTLSTGLATLSIYPSVDEETLFYKPKKK